MNNSVGIRPTQHSALGSVNVRSNAARPPAAVQNRAVIARTAPARGASQMRVHTVNSASLSSGRTGNAPVDSANQRAATQQNMPTHNTPSINNRPGNTPAMNSRPSNAPGTSQMTSPRQRELSQNRPPSAMNNSSRTSASVMGNTTSQRAGNSPRNWEAQGNATDRGRAPVGFESSNNRPTSTPAQTARLNDANRPPWARGGSPSGPSTSQSSRPTTPNYNSNRPTSSNSARSYEPPQRSQPSYNNNRSNSQPRSYNAPSGSYSAPRTYSAPSRSYPAPSRSYSAPSGGYSGGGSRGGGSRGSSGGGGGSRGGGGGGSSHGGGGGSSHGGGSSSSHGHR